MGLIRWRLALVAVFVLCGACSVYDPKLIGTAPHMDASSDSGKPDATSDARTPDTSTPDDDGGDNDSGIINPPLCFEGLDSDCPLICPETCNGIDDDCNGAIDDGPSSELCALPNAEALCISGACRITNCTGGFSDCDQTASTGCEAELNSPDHCSICFNACTYPNATGQCLNSSCAFDDCVDGFGNCDDNPANGCETSTSTIDNCGGCGTVCDPVANGIVGCIDGSCGVAECDNGFGDCDNDPSNGCETDLLGTVDNCGECDNVCMFETASASCSAGFCVPGTCTGGRADCDGEPGNGCEINILDDEANCGSCGGSCTAGQFANAMTAECKQGTCSPDVCNAGFADCDGNPANGCETSLRTTTDCGGCGTACSFDHAGATCATGTCQLGACDPLWDNCDSNATNGCERPTNTLTDCGSCNTVCSPGGTPSCASGVCSIASCMAPLADCNGNINDSCEVNTNTSMAHCGGCNNACSPTAPNGSRTCTGGQCVLSCASGFGNCDGNAANGCETALNSLSNCGACGTTCSFPNSGASCAGGTCQLGACNPGFDNCTPAPGCETQLNTLTNCNGCGDSCNLNNATEACVSGSCNLTQCDSGFGNCNNMSGDGCEIPLNTLSNCNGCGVTCNLANASETCASQTCRINQCQGLFANCNNQDNDGCERPTSTLTDCGGCGVTCDFANASESCSTGTCTFGACNSGFKSCDSNPANGCEQPLNTLAHCGDCNVACARTNATATCGSGGCAIQQCNAGFATCDSNDANGCETALGTLTNCGSCGNACGAGETCTNFQCRGSFPYTPSNFDPMGIAHTAVTTINCNAVFNSQSSTFTTWCSGQPQPSITTRTQTGGPDVVVLGFDTLTINANNTLKLEGDKPVIIAVYGDATINGTINASATDATSGPSGVSCSGTVGGDDTTGDDGASGGGGGGFGISGGASGAGNAGAASVAGGAAAGNAQLSPLRGGCSGGRGGRGHPSQNTGREGGGAGGAVQVSVAGTLTINGVIAAAGGGGRKGGSHEDGGGGGGSGGAVLLEANIMSVATSAWITVNGGGGAGGNATDNANGGNGSNGSLNNSTRANGGSGAGGGGVVLGNHSGGGNGGVGAAGSQAAANGNNASAGSGFGADAGGGGGGGGGAVGRVRIRAQSVCTFAANQSPAATRAGVCSFPESNCIGRTFGTHGYYFCPNTVGWVTASGLCQTSGMRLVRIDNAMENAFITTNAAAGETAIGAGDAAVEGVWRWENNNDQFWMGVSDGTTVSGRYANWNPGEPNEFDHGGGIGEDCAYLNKDTGAWNDNACTDPKPYVCESQ